jgi:hypothetical protein
MFLQNCASAGIWSPTDLAILQRVVDRVCKERNTRPDSDDGTDTAIRILYFYERGMTDEESLYAAATGRLGESRAA